MYATAVAILPSTDTNSSSNNSSSSSSSFNSYNNLASGNKQKRVATISMLTAGVSLRLPINDVYPLQNNNISSTSTIKKNYSGNNEIILSVVVSKRGGRMLRIYRHNDTNNSQEFLNNKNTYNSRFLMKQSQWEAVATKKAQIKSMSNLLMEYNCFFHSISLSLVLDYPIRKEFMNATFSGLASRIELGHDISAFEFFLNDLLIDNYSESMVYPALVHR